MLQIRIPESSLNVRAQVELKVEFSRQKSEPVQTNFNVVMKYLL